MGLALRKDEAELLYCSFCGTDENHVAKLIAGPEVLICDECIGRCNAILAEYEGQDIQSDKALGLTCSFCGLDDTRVARLIAGPSVYICDACTGKCTAILDAEPA